ncbi:hypothetical protein QN416_23060 [Glaciimonas sp. Cout2]|uniref:hypothetical protein n=1 Tax=Glaciimonas sp. Cout2 TaxID=3048621 RepID=UPI002B22A0EA|nr:hypothetical protein [Glaciimonas sp. Cout2]MEB0014481.1 hypothetical protein [Glaciimonas sp. Cout2]
MTFNKRLSTKHNVRTDAGIGTIRNTKEKILEVLNDKKYLMRTVSGIATQAGLKRASVVYALKNDNALRNTIKLYPLRSTNGNVLITTKERFSNEAPVTVKFVDFFSTRRPKLSDVDD